MTPLHCFKPVVPYLIVYGSPFAGRDAGKERPFRTIGTRSETRGAGRLARGSDGNSRPSRLDVGRGPFLLVYRELGGEVRLRRRRLGRLMAEPERDHGVTAPCLRSMAVQSPTICGEARFFPIKSHGGHAVSACFWSRYCRSSQRCKPNPFLQFEITSRRRGLFQCAPFGHDPEELGPEPLACTRWLRRRAARARSKRKPSRALGYGRVPRLHARTVRCHRARGGTGAPCHKPHSGRPRPPRVL